MYVNLTNCVWVFIFIESKRFSLSVSYTDFYRELPCPPGVIKHYPCIAVFKLVCSNLPTVNMVSLRIAIVLHGNALSLDRLMLCTILVLQDALLKVNGKKRHLEFKKSFGVTTSVYPTANNLVTLRTFASCYNQYGMM